MMRTLSTGLFLFVSCVVASGASPQTDEFTKQFYSADNVSAYVKAVDDLIDLAEAKIYSSIEAVEEDAQVPTAKTRNGVFMLYTLSHQSDVVVVHFSVSRAPYLPTAFGRTMIGLFMARSGWPKPSTYEVSKNQVFHASWVLPEALFRKTLDGLAPLRKEAREIKDA